MIVAYIDPGAGSMLVQAILAGIFTIPFVFRSALSRTIARLRGHRHPAVTGARQADSNGAEGEA